MLFPTQAVSVGVLQVLYEAAICITLGVTTIKVTETAVAGACWNSQTTVQSITSMSVKPKPVQWTHSSKTPIDSKRRYILTNQSWGIVTLNWTTACLFCPLLIRPWQEVKLVENHLDCTTICLSWPPIHWLWRRRALLYDADYPKLKEDDFDSSPYSRLQV